MLLADLDRLYEKLLAEDRLTPPGFQKRRIRIQIELDITGGCVSAIDTDRDGPQTVVPVLSRSGSNPPASIVVDNGQYVLGIAKKAEAKEKARAIRAWESYGNRLDEALGDLAGVKVLSDQLIAIQRFTSDLKAARVALEARGIVFEAGLDGIFPHASGLVRFRVDGADPVEHPALQEWWSSVVDANLGTGELGICQVTGETQKIARLMPSVRGVGGTQPKLISSNFDASERYNASQSSGSQVGVATAVRTHQALNWLLEDPGHHRRLGGLTFVWWVVDDPDFDPFSPVLFPEESIDHMMSAAWRGKQAAMSSRAFRLLALSVNEARVVVRLDHVTALSDLQRRIDRWLSLVEVPGKGGKLWKVPIAKLANSALGPGSGSARQAQEDRVVADLAIALVTGRVPGKRVRNAVVLRCRAERSVSPTRAALLKICQQFQEVGMSDDQPTAGELCGRLLAQLEQAQRAALGDTNRTVTDRYYAKASVNPEQVFPQLLRGAQAHLAKAGRRNKGAQIAISRRLGELAVEIHDVGGIPRVLSMHEQADFALGYWQERQLRFTKSTDKKSLDDQSDEESE